MSYILLISINSCPLDLTISVDRRSQILTSLICDVIYTILQRSLSRLYSCTILVTQRDMSILVFAGNSQDTSFVLDQILQRNTPVSTSICSSIFPILNVIFFPCNLFYIDIQAIISRRIKESELVLIFNSTILYCI